MKSVEFLEWKYEDDEIDDDVEDCTHPSLEVDVVAGSLVSAVQLLPGIGNRVALKGRGQNKRKSIGDTDSDHAVNDLAELLLWKDT